MQITSLTDIIGRTPLVNLPSLPHDTSQRAQLLGKLEYMNPGASIKDRVAKHIANQLDSRNTPAEAVLVVAGPGNLAISMTMVQRRKIISLVPERTSADRIRLLKAAGVTDIVRTLDGALPGSPEHSVEIGKRIMASHGPNTVYIDEELGDWDLKTCYSELANEIVEQTDGQLDALVLGVDTGNAATHLSLELKRKLPQVQIVGVEPSNSAISDPEPGTANPLTRRWLCEDIGRVYAPRALAPNSIDMWIQVSDSIAYSMTRRLIQAGIHAGPSSGASLAAARMYAVSAGLQSEQRVVVLMGDSARNYSDTLLSDDWMLGHDLLDARMLDDLQRKQLGQYRGASIEDLQLPAAVTVSESDTVGAAVALMIEQDFSQVPVTGSGRRLIGYLTLSAAQTLLENQTTAPDLPVKQVMLKFTNSRAAGIRKQYWLITPETSLSELSKFFDTHSVAFITDASRKFCLGIATKQDLINFLARRK